MSSRRSALRAATTTNTNTSSRASSDDSVSLAPLTTRARKAGSKERDTQAPAPKAKTASKRPLRTIDEDVIVISSDSEDERAAATLKREKSLLQENERLKRQVEQLLARPQQQQQQPDKGKKRPRDEDDDGESAHLRTKLAKVAQDAEQLKRKLNATEKEVQQLKGKNISVDGLREHLECEICMDTLWLPWALSECGHTFCQSCLISLFNDRKFTCPQCRVAVRRRPVEVYALKSMIRAIAGPAPPEVDMLADSQHVWDALWPRGAADPPAHAHAHAHANPHARVHANPRAHAHAQPVPVLHPFFPVLHPDLR
ncbi:hypothetical protein EXIGLDRAFT_838323 [Exidia glandulosa HHB12029]|uniref:RING-type domain-containing protein n=1 Tax=Exidia glandulosa HHB12029 TaxID=1314781 RepID=A0A165FYX5_EXIGL|nr:hypothetical protein EXIGLDRAFT_838323 [Exidia glandulosa HHB12029]